MICSVDHNGFYYWVGATDQRHEGTWLWGSMEPVQDFVWFESIHKFLCFATFPSYHCRPTEHLCQAELHVLELGGRWGGRWQVTHDTYRAEKKLRPAILFSALLWLFGLYSLIKLSLFLSLSPLLLLLLNACLGTLGIPSILFRSYPMHAKIAKT